LILLEVLNRFEICYKLVMKPSKRSGKSARNRNINVTCKKLNINHPKSHENVDFNFTNYQIHNEINSSDEYYINQPLHIKSFFDILIFKEFHCDFMLVQNIENF